MADTPYFAFMEEGKYCYVSYENLGVLGRKNVKSGIFGKKKQEVDKVEAVVLEECSDNSITDHV